MRLQPLLFAKRVAKFAVLVAALYGVIYGVMRVGARYGFGLGAMPTELPKLEAAEQNRDGDGGRLDKVTGPIELKNAGKKSEDAVGEGEEFSFATHFGLVAGSSAGISTEGNWEVELTGEGSFLFEDARTDANHTRHTSVWHVKKGTFLAHTREFDSSEHWMLVKTPLARILFRNAELGLKVTEGGRGQVWIQSGSGVIIWNDGRKKELQVKGMEYL